MLGWGDGIPPATDMLPDFSRVISEVELRVLAVEFPSPCDGTRLIWQFVFGGLDKENRAPSKKCNLYRPEGLSKDEPPRGPYHTKSPPPPTA
jgi:hypothetical protein